MRTLFALVLVLWCGTSFADTTVIEDGCVKYLETGKVYNVRISIVDGQDLWPKYAWANVLTKYAIVFWNKDDATVVDSRPCRIHPRAVNDNSSRRCGGRRCGDRADAVAFIGSAIACDKQARHASTADRA